MKDTDLMPFGKYKGEAMANVPALWLVMFWDANKFYFLEGLLALESQIKVMQYIQDYGVEHLRKEVKNG